MVLTSKFYLCTPQPPTAGGISLQAMMFLYAYLIFGQFKIRGLSLDLGLYPLRGSLQLLNDFRSPVVAEARLTIKSGFGDLTTDEVN